MKRLGPGRTFLAAWQRRAKGGGGTTLRASAPALERAARARWEAGKLRHLDVSSSARDAFLHESQSQNKHVEIAPEARQQCLKLLCAVDLALETVEWNLELLEREMHKKCKMSLKLDFSQCSVQNMKENRFQRVPSASAWSGL